MPKLYDLTYALNAILATFLAFSTPTMAQPDFNKLADSIWLAEGGKNARKPFGIISVACSTYSDCRVICLNTIRNNWKRYQTQPRRNEDFISFLGRQYAPTSRNVTNDPNHLNQFWIKNVRYFYEH